MKGRYAMGVCKPNALMPLCSVNDQQKILDVIASLHIADRRPSEKLVEQMGADELCRVLHAIRRWYTSNAWSAAEKVLKHVDVLEKGMDLRPPIGAYRGLKVDVKDPLARLQEGETVTIPVKRNGGCSSWTLGRALADRFSGSPKGKVGIVVRLVSGEGVQAFIAPPERCEGWWNRLYAKTMGTSHRRSEREYAICASKIRAEVVRVKR